MRGWLVWLACLTGGAWAQQGTYICPGLTGTEVVQIGPKAYQSEVRSPQGDSREYGPVVKQGENGWVVGPLPDRMKPYEAIWLVEQKPDYLVLARTGTQYDLPSQVPARPDPAELKSSRRFWSRARYEQLLKLPVWKKPEREAIVELLDLTRDRLPAGSGAPALERALEDALIERGFEPFQSKAVLLQVCRDLGQKDPELSRRVEELHQWASEKS